MTTRRSFLARGGAAIAGATLLGSAAGCGPEDERAKPAGAFVPADWDSVRGQFMLKPGRTHVSTFVLATHPAPVRAAIEKHRRGLDEDTLDYLHRNQGRLEAEVRASASRYLGADRGEIAFTDSTTMGLGTVYGGLRLRQSDEVLTTEHDFYSTHESLRLAAARSGATVRKVRLYTDPAKADPDAIVDTLRRAVTPRTRAVAVTWVHSGTGVKLPIRRIADALAGLGAAPADRPLLCVDGVHGFAANEVSVRDLGCDVLVSGCHKWLYGPRGTGLIWARRDAWARIAATIPTFDPDGSAALGAEADGTPMVPGPRMTPGGYHSFEHRWALAEAFAFHQQIGPKRVAERTTELATRLKDGLAEMSHVQLTTPRSAEMSAGIVCFAVRNTDPFEVVERLENQHKVIASTTPYLPILVRFGPSIVNSTGDVDAALKAVERLA
jgi:selenocysteine lyase/cysteine desulfurase